MEKKMFNLDKFINTVKTIYPRHAEITKKEPSKIRICWNLNPNDSERPNKKSKIILIEFSREFIDDYNAMNQNDKSRKDVAVTQVVTNHYSSFDPNHTATAHETPPIEIININTNI
jgi:hypothetical protein